MSRARGSRRPDRSGTTRGDRLRRPHRPGAISGRPAIPEALGDRRARPETPQLSEAIRQPAARRAHRQPVQGVGLATPMLSRARRRRLGAGQRYADPRLRVISDEVMAKGHCDRSIAEIAAPRGGWSQHGPQRGAVRQVCLSADGAGATARGQEELTNLVRIINHTWLTWLRR